MQFAITLTHLFLVNKGHCYVQTVQIFFFFLFCNKIKREKVNATLSDVDIYHVAFILNGLNAAYIFF